MSRAAKGLRGICRDPVPEPSADRFVLAEKRRWRGARRREKLRRFPPLGAVADRTGPGVQVAGLPGPVQRESGRRALHRRDYRALTVPCSEHPYPSSRTADRILSVSNFPSTRAIPAARSTSTAVTPSTRDKARSTWVLQWLHIMPSILKRFSMGLSSLSFEDFRNRRTSAAVSSSRKSTKPMILCG